MLSIKTRSKTLDYIDYGNNPYTDWKKEWGIKGIGADPLVDPPAGEAAADICLLVDNGQWKGAVYWLYGNRKDKENRSIRYGIVGCGLVGDDDAKIFCRLCAHILEGRKAQDNLAQLLDIHFTDEAIQELLNKQSSSKEEAYQQVRGILSQVVGQLPNPADTTPFREDVTSSLRCEMVSADNTKKIRQCMQLLICQEELSHPILLFHGVTGAKVDTGSLGGKVAGCLVSDHWEGGRPREGIPVGKEVVPVRLFPLPPDPVELEPTKAEINSLGIVQSEDMMSDILLQDILLQIEDIISTLKNYLDCPGDDLKVKAKYLLSIVGKGRKTVKTVLQKVEELKKSIVKLQASRENSCSSSPANRDIFM